MLISKNIILFLAAPSAAGCKACLEQPRLKTMDTCLDVIFSLFLRKCCKNILDNFGNKCHLRGAQRNTVIQRSRALPSRSSRTSLCIRHCLVSGIHMIFIRHVMRSSGGCSSGGGSSGGSSSGWPKEIKFIKSNEIKFLNSTSW